LATPPLREEGAIDLLFLSPSLLPFSTCLSTVSFSSYGRLESSIGGSLPGFPSKVGCTNFLRIFSIFDLIFVCCLKSRNSWSFAKSDFLQSLVKNILHLQYEELLRDFAIFFIDLFKLGPAMAQIQRPRLFALNIRD